MVGERIGRGEEAATASAPRGVVGLATRGSIDDEVLEGDAESTTAGVPPVETVAVGEGCGEAVGNSVATGTWSSGGGLTGDVPPPAIRPMRAPSANETKSARKTIIAAVRCMPLASPRALVAVPAIGSSVHMTHSCGKCLCGSSYDRWDQWNGQAPGADHIRTGAGGNCSMPRSTWLRYLPHRDRIPGLGGTERIAMEFLADEEHARKTETNWLAAMATPEGCTYTRKVVVPTRQIAPYTKR